MQHERALCKLEKEVLIIDPHLSTRYRVTTELLRASIELL